MINLLFKQYSYYIQGDNHQEPINCVDAPSRLAAAKYFAKRKRLTIKQFLKLYSVSRS